MRTSKLLTTLAIVSVALIAGCNCNEKGGLWPNGNDNGNSWDPGSWNGDSGSGKGGSGSGTLAKGAVDLGTAGNFVILSKSGITNVPTSAITGDIGVSPIDAAAITGFALIMDGSGTFSTSAQVTGKVYAADYADPTPATLTTAVLDMEAAYTDAAGRAADFTELYSGDISGKTLAPGVYKWSTGVLINGGVTLSGGKNAVWIFQIAKGLTVGDGAIITLSGGAQAKNIFWQVAETVALGTTSHFEGTILGMTDITLTAGASVNGRLLAQTDVTLDQNTVTVSGTSGGGTNPGHDGDHGNGDGCKDNDDNGNHYGWNDNGKNDNGKNDNGKNDNGKKDNGKKDKGRG